MTIFHQKIKDSGKLALPVCLFGILVLLLSKMDFYLLKIKAINANLKAKKKYY